MKNIIENVKRGETWSGYPNKSGYDLARAIADGNEIETGNKTIVTRIVDYVDQYNNRDREHFSFDVIEIISE